MGIKEWFCKKSMPKSKPKVTKHIVVDAGLTEVFITFSHLKKPFKVLVAGVAAYDFYHGKLQVVLSTICAREYLIRFCHGAPATAFTNGYLCDQVMVGKVTNITIGKTSLLELIVEVPASLDTTGYAEC